jgi:hypothetical protein
MAINWRSIGQSSLFEVGIWRARVSIEASHRLVVLCRSIPWDKLIKAAIPILYDESGVAQDCKGRRLDLRAHLGAYILQTVHGWTDRWTEEMLKFYIPARLFCGYLESDGSLDHTSIEEFRTRFGSKGAALITRDMMIIAKECGFTKADDVDMDTTVQEAGITHPTEMKLLGHLMKRMMALHGKLKEAGGHGIQGTKRLFGHFKKCFAEYRFFAKSKAKKDKLARKAVTLSKQALMAMSKCLPGRHDFDKLQSRYQQEIVRLTSLGSELMDQITYWLNTGRVAKDKIVSLWKTIPQAIPRGKTGKAVEFGRKWIINCYHGGYMVVLAPDNPKISDQHCVIESLAVHSNVFDTMPRTYGTDRGMYSQQNQEICLSAGIKKIGIQTKGRATPLVGPRIMRDLSNRRAGIEPRLGHLKSRGLGRSRMKSDIGDLISGYRSALSWNLSLLMRDLISKPPEAVLQC